MRKRFKFTNKVNFVKCKILIFKESDSLPFSMNGVRGKKAAFNGMRGKKAAFNGMRGRRAAFVGMRGKRAPFNGMRGKRDLSSSGKKLEVPVSSSDW